MLHPGIICYFCEKPVYDVHYRCEECPDWYLCQACVWLLPIRVKHHSEHEFKPYKYSQDDNAFCIAPSPSGALARSRPLIAVTGKEIRISWEYIPWKSDLSTAYFSKIAEERLLLGSMFDVDEENRTVMWGLVQVASSGVLSESDLFRHSGAGVCYALTPPWRSSVPLQWVHVGPRAIPNSLADIPSNSLTMEDLLSHLNTILGTAYTLDMPGLQPCLEHARHTSHDLGQLYGILRPWWSEGFTQTLARMLDRQDEVQRRRDEATDGSCIRDSQFPPRRVWDLYSNRVLPFHVIPPLEHDPYHDRVPENLWTVSHSWVDEKDRTGVMTTVNGRQWPVPIPRQTTLDHVRIELLNMGAKYVWLDVLCLRQEGGVDDDCRLEEWKLDVPTIGYIYRARPKSRPCITYFNGLGLPLDTSPATRESTRHWSKRVWTLQESLESWFPGGLTADPGAHSSALFSELEDLLHTMSGWGEDGDRIFQAVQMRHCTTDLDRIAGLGYILGCTTLPLYDRTISVESAWRLLVKHMEANLRTDCFLQYPSDTPFGLWMSAKGVLTSQPALPHAVTGFDDTLGGGKLKLVEEQELYTSTPGQYQQVGLALGPCRITRSACHNKGSGACSFHFQFEGTTNLVTIPITVSHGIFLPTVAYTLLGVGKFEIKHWVVTEIVSEQQVDGETALEAVKWGVLYIDPEEASGVEMPDLPEPEETRVVYLTGEEALARSKHVDEYMTAFEEARAENTT